MRFPLIVRKRRAQARVYGRSRAYGYYRVAYHAAGRRVVRSFTSYSAAVQAAKAAVDQMARGSQELGLSAREVADALAIRDLLAEYQRQSGRKLTALQAVGQFIDAAKLLPPGGSVAEAVANHLKTTETIRPKGLADAVEEYLQVQTARAVAKEGKRPQLCVKYVENITRWLREFASTFRGHHVSDLSKELLNQYIGAFTALSAKSRNDRRATLRQFLAWLVARDYLSPTHRLTTADGMKNEPVDVTETDFYRPDEFHAMLEAAAEDLRPMLALQGLAGLRMEEALRLTWKDVFGIPGHVEVSSFKSKTRQRRLVEIGPALNAWLEAYHGMMGPVWKGTRSQYLERYAKLRESLAIPYRRNGLRHAWCSHLFALTGNENIVAAQAGHSPAQLHQHYRGLCTKAEGQKWFSIVPARAENVIALPVKEIGG